ncbi:hypothetical protein [Alloactinosynnema sp. L-07]|nr:hypothetical protein [Alloactinosynnema sp. L-07]
MRVHEVPAGYCEIEGLTSALAAQELADSLGNGHTLMCGP